MTRKKKTETVVEDTRPWWERPISIPDPRSSAVINGYQGGAWLAECHYWPDHETQQKELAGLFWLAAALRHNQVEQWFEGLQNVGVSDGS